MRALLPMGRPRCEGLCLSLSDSCSGSTLEGSLCTLYNGAFARVSHTKRYSHCNVVGQCALVTHTKRYSGCIVYSSRGSNPVGMEIIEPILRGVAPAGISIHGPTCHGYRTRGRVAARATGGVEVGGVVRSATSKAHVGGRVVVNCVGARVSAGGVRGPCVEGASVVSEGAGRSRLDVDGLIARKAAVCEHERDRHTGGGGDAEEAIPYLDAVPGVLAEGAELASMEPAFIMWNASLWMRTVSALACDPRPRGATTSPW